MTYTIKELSELTGKSKTMIYRYAHMLGRMPTIAEIKNWRKVGRPRKYKY